MRTLTHSPFSWRLSHPMGVLLAFGATACVPVLTSESSDETASDWEAPENAWVSATPPVDLEGEGFGVGKVAPDMRLTDQNGQEVSLWQFYGSVIVLDVSTMWCAPCQQLADEICTVQRDYEDQGFMYLTVLPQNESGAPPSLDDVNEWTDDHGICAPVLGDDGTFGTALVPDGAFPSLSLIDRDMTMVEDRISPAEDARIRELIESLL